MKRLIINVIFLIFTVVYCSFAQIKGEPPKIYNPDTLFIFKSPRPLVYNDSSDMGPRNAWGLNIMVSGNGMGGGIFYHRKFSDDFYAVGSFLISGARNTDELEEWVPDESNQVFILKVPDKINRLFMFPLTLGVQYNIFSGSLSENFKPFIEAGNGVCFIIAAPYDREWFNSFKYADGFIRYAAYIGLGANFSIKSNTIFGVSGRYYFIPFGGKGIESVKNHPLTDFGGVFLSMNMGIRF